MFTGALVLSGSGVCMLIGVPRLCIGFTAYNEEGSQGDNETGTKDPSRA